MLCIQPGWLPAVVGILLSAGALLAFATSVAKGDVTPYLPFISEAGTYLPQSGIFSIFMIWTAIASSVTMYIRYLIVKDFMGPVQTKWPLLVNVWALLVGLVSSFGLIIIAVYPLTSVELAHDIGAYSTFLMGVVYSFLQTYLTYKLYPEFNGIGIFRVRLLISLLSFTSLFFMITFYVLAGIEWNSVPQSRERSKRLPIDKGFLEWTLAASGEWLIALFFVLFFFTFIREFQKIYVNFSARVLVKHFDDQANLSLSYDVERQPILVR